MKIVVVGLGYVGITAAACLSSQGHTIVGVDVNPDKVEAFNAGISPISEPQVSELLQSAHAEDLLAASSQVPALDDVDAVLVCVGTPSARDGSHNMNFIIESTRQIAAKASLMEDRTVSVVYRSTVKPGTMDKLISPIFKDAIGDSYEECIDLVYNPEFLRESSAVYDYFNPPKIVIGTRDSSPSKCMESMYEGIVAPTFNIGFRESEITKFVDNSWHAVKVAFANEVGRISAAYSVDTQTVHEIFVSDTKLNISAYYTRPGNAFGGSCLPKDVRAMQYLARSGGVKAELLGSLMVSNESHMDFQFSRVKELAEPGCNILVMGLAFKQKTDDMRESPNVALVARLIRAGYNVRVFDPEVHKSSLVGQNLAHVLTELPSLRELLVSEESLTSLKSDLVVLNHKPPEGFLIDPERTVDLRIVSAVGQEKANG